MLKHSLIAGAWIAKQAKNEHSLQNLFKHLSRSDKLHYQHFIASEKPGPTIHNATWTALPGKQHTRTRTHIHTRARTHAHTHTRRLFHKPNKFIWAELLWWHHSWQVSLFNLAQERRHPQVWHFFFFSDTFKASMPARVTKMLKETSSRQW